MKTIQINNMPYQLECEGPYSSREVIDNGTKQVFYYITSEDYTIQDGNCLTSLFPHPLKAVFDEDTATNVVNALNGENK